MSADPVPGDEIAALRRRLARERQARLDAEAIAERGMSELYQRQQEISLLEAIATDANQATDRDAAFALAVGHICRYTQWPVGHAFILDAESSAEPQLKSSGVWHCSNPARFEPFRAATTGVWDATHRGLPGRVFSSGQPAWIVDVTRDPDFPRAAVAQAVGLQAAFAFPVLVGDEVGAVLEFFADRRAEPDESLLRIMAHVGTQLGRVVERQRANESRLRAVVETAVDGIIMIDGQGQVQSFNGAAERILGWKADEVIGRNINLLMPEPYHSQHDGYLAAYHATGHANIIGKGRDVEALTKDGRVVPIRLAVGRVNLPGAPLYVGFITDISERRAYEQNLREAKERAELAAAARSTFLANMSHEIRTPMNAIIGFTEALLDSKLDATQRRHLGTVHNSARSMLRLLNDILDTAKLEKGAVDLEIADFSLRELCQQILTSQRIMAVKKALALDLDYPETEPDYLRGDALRLQQVLVNLLGNAIKFTAKGRVLLRVRYVAGKLQFDVEDTGIGMDAKTLERIFDPFAQADASTTRRFGGTGLGTTISRQLVEVMQGRISVRSTVDVGTVFSVIVPLPLGDASAATHDRNLQQSVHALPSLRVLAADDVHNNLELLQITLENGRHTVTLAHGGEEAVALCAEERFDVVLMDLQMPGVAGLEATRRIRAHEQAQGLRPVPIIALSASVMEQDRRDARAAGMDGFAVKPLELPRLFAEIARVLGLRADAMVSAPALSRPRVEAGGPSVIDWERGLRLWTQAPLMRAAIERFLQESSGLPERLRVLCAEADWNSLAVAVHRARGVAGNLALMPLHALLTRIETAARAADAAAAQDALAALPDAWEAVEQALSLAQTDAPPEAASVHAVGSLDTLSAAELAQSLAVLDRVAAALTQGELPEADLAALAELLPALALEPVREAVDSFDFDRAQAHLLALRESIATQPPQESRA